MTDANSNPPADTPPSPADFYVPDQFRSAIAKEEGGFGTGLNKQGYAGKYQMGTAALNSAGLYTPADGENLSSNQWKGKITVPGYDPMDLDAFLKNEGAQDAAFNAHMHNLAGIAHDMGLTDYIGQTVGGVPITQESLASMMHFAGPGGTRHFLQSGGTYNPADANGTRLASYATRVGGAPGSAIAAAPAASAPALAPAVPAIAPAPATPSSNGLAQLQRVQQYQQLAALNQLIQANTPKQSSGPNANIYNPGGDTAAILQAGNIGGGNAGQQSPMQNLMMLARLRNPLLGVG